jgi:predicted neuraminidase
MRHGVPCAALSDRDLTESLSGSCPLRSEFIFEGAPFASAHASTIAETAEGVVAAWFGGPREGHPDVGIWLARKAAGQWSTPVEVARGIDRRGRPQACWNPVLHQATGGPLLLFYKVGPSPRRWWGMLSASADGGRSWSAARRLPRGVLGPIKNKPVVLGDGSLLCPSSTEHLGWRAHLERTADLGESWEKLRPLNRWRELGAIQPCILAYPSGRMQVLCRTRQRVIAACWSSDGGRTWGSMQATSLPNPDSGIDAVALHDGRALLAYNPSRAARTPLCLAVSSDGVAWRNVLVLADGVGEYSYPAIIQGQDRSLHVTYTWNRRRIRYGRLSPDEISERDSSAP